MSVLDTIRALAKADPKHIAMAEGADPRIVEGSLRAVREGLAQVTLIGPEAQVHAAVAAGGGRPDEVRVVDPETAPQSASYAARYEELRKHKGVTADQAVQAMQNPLAFAAMMVRQGDAHGTVGGAVATTADTLRADLQIIGLAPGVGTVSSFFIMVLDQPHHPKQDVLAFADCALVIDPSADEMAQIAVATARSYQALTEQTPRVAMLSFSTAGSAKHERVEKVADATRLASERAPELTLGGELQFDSAFVPSVGQSKAPGSPVAGDANVFVFPSLEAANIGYKIAQRIGGAKAIGPILQGMAQPANDLSRGCSADDVYNMIAVTGVQAARAQG